MSDVRKVGSQAIISSTLTIYRTHQISVNVGIITLLLTEII